MAINSSAFVKPAITEAGIYTQHQIILLAVNQKIGCVEIERRITIVVSPKKISV